MTLSCINFLLPENEKSLLKILFHCIINDKHIKDYYIKRSRRQIFCVPIVETEVMFGRFLTKDPDYVKILSMNFLKVFCFETAC